jgi:peptide/nickel transport system substrate-binding protein
VKSPRWRGWQVAGLALLACVASDFAIGAVAGSAAASGPTGRFGGTLVVSQRAEPRTFNPFTALDVPSRDAIRLLMADLVSIDRSDLGTVPALAESWTIDPDRRTLDVVLRPGLRFSDGSPLTTDDVVFSLEAHLDPRVGSPQRESLAVGGRPPRIVRLDERRLRIELAATYAPGERLLDSIFVVPRRLLEPRLRDGSLGTAWGPGTPVGELVGAGPYRLQAYEPGKRLVYERNPHYWKRDEGGRRLPFLDRIEIRFFGDAESEALQLRAGQIDLLARLPAKTFSALQQRLPASRYRFQDAGPGLDYHFLVFNLGSGATDATQRRRQGWFRDPRFRRAVSQAADRDAIVRLVYDGRAAPIWQPVSPANRPWFDASLPRPSHSIVAARQDLAAAGFRVGAEGALVDRDGVAVTFTLLANSANPQHLKIAAILTQDLRSLGIGVQVVPLEFRSLLDRVLSRRDHDAALMALAPGDSDPASEMNVWLSSGRSHVWDPQPAQNPDWQLEIDALMRSQLVTTDPRQRRRAYQRVQQVAQREMPLVCLVSPHMLTVVRRGLRNFRPGLLPPFALADADVLSWDENGTR